MGLNVFEISLNVSMNTEQVTEPRQFDFLSFRVIGVMGPHKVYCRTQRA